MIKLSVIPAILLILAIPVTAANVTAVEIHGVVFDSNSKIYNRTLQWDAQNFTGFWYNSGAGKESETLTITEDPSKLTASSRVIPQEKVLYKTVRTDATYGVFTNVNKKVENGLEYNKTTGFTKNNTGDKFARLGWFGDQYVAVNGKANKLARLLINHGSNIKDKKTLKLGTTWELGEGYNLTVEALDTRTSPRQVFLKFTKDGRILDNRVVNEGEVFTYIEKSISQESDVPLFVTYVESIFSGAEGTETFVQLRYTWLISQNVLEIKEGDKFGIFEVKEANENYALLYNKDAAIKLDQNTVQTLYGELKFRVADSSTALRFYPVFEKTAPGNYELRGGTYDESKFKNLVWDAQRFPGFWYNSVAGKESETLTVTEDPSKLTASSRVIPQEKLLYKTIRTDANYGVFTNVNKKVENALEYNKTTGFTKNTTGDKFARLGWFGDQYVAVNGKANKLAKLLINHGSNIKDKKTLKLGATWELGEGYNLTVEALDTRTSPRQAWLKFTKDGRILDNRVVNEGEVFTYVEKSIGQESDVPLFVTYVESIFSGAEESETFVQLRYTWLISQNVLEIKEGDKFGVFEVKEANENYVLLYNKDAAIKLDQNTVQSLYGELKFKVADSSTALRFYPLFEHTILPPKEKINATNAANANAPTAIAVATPTSTAQSSSLNKAVTSTTKQLAQTETPVKTQGDTATPAQWNWLLYAIAGFVAMGYIVLRRF